MSGDHHVEQVQQIGVAGEVATVGSFLDFSVDDGDVRPPFSCCRSNSEGISTLLGRQLDIPSRSPPKLKRARSDGYHSKIKGNCVSVATDAGDGVTKRKMSHKINGSVVSYTEDRVLSASNGRFELYGVMDGHGGYEVSDLISKEIMKRFVLNGPTGSICEYLANLIADIHRFAEQRIFYTGAGSTLVMAIVDNVDSIAYVANLGDSRCLIVRGNECIFQTVDMSADNPVEVARLNELGYSVSRSSDGAMRIDCNGLQVTAGVGDFRKGTFGLEDPVRRVPDISQVSLQSGDIILLSSDGLFDSPGISRGLRRQLTLMGGLKPIEQTVSDMVRGAKSGNLAKHMIKSHIDYLFRMYKDVAFQMYGEASTRWADEDILKAVTTGSDNKSVVCVVYDPDFA